MLKANFPIRPRPHTMPVVGLPGVVQELFCRGRSLNITEIKQTYPGWGFMVSKGANTCWEQWNGFWSQVHSCYTSGGGWFYTGVACIRQVEKSVAFKHMLIAPQLTDKISGQETHFNSPYGKVLVSWTHTPDSGLQIEIDIPVNTKADVILPVSGNEIVYESGEIPGKNDEIKVLSKESGSLRVTVTSGKYIFEVRKKS